ncbi:hypothetical protein RZS08_34255, partial [Arthrospira platensis SPKY1]|nr:hypothetical protein [Arthrospira platensis SPKY1]
MMDWLYRKRVKSFADMSNLPQKLRFRLEEHFCMLPSSQLMVKQANDITEKLLLQHEDQRLVETVLISYPQKGVGQEDSRRTICVSSQVGCAYG